MKNTLRKIVLGLGLVGALLNAGCKKEESKKYSIFPEVKSNQQLILHQSYLSGKEAVAYTLLTDLDRDGQWDLAERCNAGWTTGSYSQEVIYKKGYGPAQCTDNPNTTIKFVEPEFFNRYE